ncbi:hypothetical protein NDU88_007814 [Pleurodeles waltl]|uniref:Uncharacterized protein n=1 Tax=Pleurodeles waltl TaxID=8319 RepID=A0AAV7NYH0_PLEWA|nr:hypothetical protein NDU88_007814 [Pleurodeles waltl]
MPEGPFPVSIYCTQPVAAAVISLICVFNYRARGQRQLVCLEREGRVYLSGVAAPFRPLVVVCFLLPGAASTTARGCWGGQLLSPHHIATHRTESERNSSHEPRCCHARGMPPVRRGPQEGGVVPVFEGGGHPTSISLISLMRPYRCPALLSPLGSVGRRRPSLSHLGLLEARRSAAPLDRLDPRFGWRPSPEAYTTPVQPIPVFRRLQGRLYFAS